MKRMKSEMTRQEIEDQNYEVLYETDEEFDDRHGIIHKDIEKCNCHSIGIGKGKDKPAVLDPNIYFKCDEKYKKVDVDACIAHVIEHLWKNKIWTKNCCCGHNGDFFEKSEGPEIIFEGNLKKEKADEIRKLIKEVDDREFEISSWILTKI